MMQENVVVYGHSQVEIALEDSVIPFTANSPGFFASDSQTHNPDTSRTPWEAILVHDSGTRDNICPLDIGQSLVLF